MVRRAHDPRRLDVARFAAAGEQLDGRWRGGDLERLAGSQALPQDQAAADVTWHCTGERRPVAGGEDQIRLHLVAESEVWLTCQRCLQPLRQPLAIDRWLRFVPGETDAEALDAESEEDVLALSTAFDLRDLVEDELLLALPLVPRHASCSPPLPLAAAAPATLRPFEVLRPLKSADSDEPA